MAAAAVPGQAAGDFPAAGVAGGSRLALLPLETLPRPESLALLRKLAPRLKAAPDEELDPIPEKLGDLPLALDLVGRYLHERRSLTMKGFLEEVDQAGRSLGHSALVDWTKHNPTKHDTSLAATFLLSWERVEGEAARRRFCAGGYCGATTPIPWEVFYRSAGAEAGEGPAAGEGQAGGDHALGAPDDLGLLKLAGAGAGVGPPPGG